MASPNDKLYRSVDGHAWVGEHCEGSFPANATHIADLPEADDPRWRPGAPAFLDVEFITLSPFSPSGRLGVCVEKKSSKQLGSYPNHPPFEGCKAWMPVSDTKWKALPIPERNRYVVVDEHTLGYQIPEMPGYIGVLHASVLKGAVGSGHGTVLIVPGASRVRQATEEDFNDFRVVPPPCFKEDGPKRKASLGL